MKIPSTPMKGRTNLLLAIDTSSRYAGVCVMDEQRVRAGLCWYSAQNHTRELLPAIHQIMNQVGASLADFDAVAVALGPGGFSALRVGLSVAKGLAYPLGLLLVGVSTLEIEAYPYMAMGAPVCSVVDAGRSEVAAALFQRSTGANELDKLAPEGIYTGETLAQHLKGAGHPRLVVCGEGAQGIERQLKEVLGGVVLWISPYSPSTRLWALAHMGMSRVGRGAVDDLATLQPHYLRRPSIGSPRAPLPVQH